MKKNLAIIGIIICVLFMACQNEDLKMSSDKKNSDTDSPVSTQARASAVSLGITGNPADVSGTTTGGTVLMGGSTDVDEAIQWMISKAGGGDFVVIRASGTNAYNDYIYDFGGLNSVETLLINSRTIANDPAVESKIRNAEALFIAGGDQANYVNYWKDTRVEDAINYLRNTKKCPIGGTSAGSAIQTAFYFSALNGTVTSSQALANPYNRYMTIGKDDFINNPFLSNTITDTHFDNPDRRGRLIAFMARMSKDYGIVPKGIGVDEETAVCIDQNGSARIFGYGTAFFLIQNTDGPERCVSRSSLDWYRNGAAVKAYTINGNTSGSNTFNLSTWTGTGGTQKYYFVDEGVLGQ